MLGGVKDERMAKRKRERNRGVMETERRGNN